MRNAKLWSLLLATVLLCACVLGVLFVGASANDGEETFVVDGETYATIKDALDAAASRPWEAGAELVIEFTGTDDSAILTEAGEGESTNLLFGQTTIFREDGTKLPITIRGSATDIESNQISFTHGAAKGATKSYACANDYTFENLYFPLGRGNTSTQYAYFYAGSGKITFNDVRLKKSTESWGSTRVSFISADNFTMDAFYGWDADKVAANLNDEGLIETYIYMGSQIEHFPAGTGNQISVVGYSPADWSIDVSAAETAAAKVSAAKEQAAGYTYEAGQLVTKDCVVKPINTAAKIIVDTGVAIRDAENNLIAGNTSSVGIGAIKGRTGTSPVAKACIEVRSGIVGRISADHHTSNDTPRVGDSIVTVSGGSIGVGNGVSIRLLKTTLYGDLKLNVSQTTADETYIAWVQGTNDATNTAVYGTYEMNMSGGHIGSGSNGYFGMNAGQGTFAKFTGGTVSGCFYALRYSCAAKGNLPSDKIPAEYREYIDGDVQIYTEVSGTAEIQCDYYGGGGGGADVLGNIVNVVNGGTFADEYFAGNNSSATKEIGNVTNIVKSGTFGNNFVGSSHSGDVKTVKNVIEGGTFTGNANAICAYLGGTYSNGAITGGVENTISGGTFEGYILCGSRNTTKTVSNDRKDEENNPLPAILNNISGGTFWGVWGISGTVEGDVVTNISGGDFYPYQKNFTKYRISFAGGVRNSGGHTTGDVLTIISGGTFYTQVYGGTTYSVTKAMENGDLTSYAGDAKLVITGGTFEDNIYANSSNGRTDGVSYASATIEIDLSENDIKLLADVGNAALINDGTEADAFTTVNVIGGEKNLIIGKDTEIAADTATGTVKVHQTEGWLAHNYLTYTGEDVVEVTEVEGAFGSHKEEGSYVLRGMGIEVSVATLRFDKRVGVRFCFDPADVEEYGDEFTFKVVLNGETLASGTASDLEDYQGYKSFIANGIGLNDFGTTFTLTGAALAPLGENYDSIVDLAQRAQEAWNTEEMKDWKAFAEATENLYMVYKDVEGWEAKTPAAVTDVTNLATPGALIEKVKSADIGPLMGDAAGIRITLVLNEAPTSFAVAVNGHTISDCSTPSTDTETNLHTEVIDLYFDPMYMEEAFTITIANGEGEENVYFTYTDSVARLVYELSETEGNENADNAAALLYYIQKAVVCAKL